MDQQTSHRRRVLSLGPRPACPPALVAADCVMYGPPFVLQVSARTSESSSFTALLTVVPVLLTATLCHMNLFCFLHSLWGFVELLYLLLCLFPY